MELNPEQKSASEAPRGPLIIVAGAGTGKTRTLTSRLIYLMERGIRPEKICAITFTNKAAREMLSRIQNSKFYILNSKFLPFVGTFHSLGAKILRGEAAAFGRTKNFVIFDSDDSFSLIKKIAKQYAKERGREAARKENKNSPSYFAKKISEIKNAERNANTQTRANDADNANIQKIFAEYEDELKKNNAFDFDDLIAKPVSVFRKHPEILKKYRSEFDAILVDEYQDVNPMQCEFIKLLAGEHKNLSVVGDDEQMIYGWRHADIKIFLNFDREWPGARAAFLEENYRSTGNIIGAAAAVAKNNLWRTPKTLRTKNEAGAPIKIIETEDEEQEAEWIASQIQKSKIKNQNNGDVAILYRTNAQSRAIEQALIRRQIPYKIFGGVRFYERKEVKDVVAAMRLVFNPKDALSRERLEKNLPKFRFRALETALAKAMHGADDANRDNADYADNHPQNPRYNKNLNPSVLIKTFLEATDYLDYIEKSYQNADERRENIEELIDFSSRYDDLGRFLEEIALVQSTDNPSTSSVSNQPAVNLMTIHLAKGLEFDSVFIAGCSEGLLPHAMSADKADRLEEERRLMYVAMTRAKKELNIGFYGIPSRFIGEIPEEFLKYESRADNDTARDEDEKFIYLD